MCNAQCSAGVNGQDFLMAATCLAVQFSPPDGGVHAQGTEDGGIHLGLGFDREDTGKGQRVKGLGCRQNNE